MFLTPHPEKIIMKIFLLIENERTYQPRIFDRLIRACPDEVVGIGPVSYTHLRAHET